MFGCRSYHELYRVRHWDKNWPGRMLGALPKRKWVRRLQRVGQDVLVRLWRHVEAKSPATRSRWQWTWVGDDTLFGKYGRQLGLVGLGWSGQEQRVRLEISGLLLIVVIGEGKLVVPVDFTVRRPAPLGLGRPCRDKLIWLQVVLEQFLFSHASYPAALKSLAHSAGEQASRRVPLSFQRASRRRCAACLRRALRVAQRVARG